MKKKTRKQKVSTLGLTRKDLWLWECFERSGGVKSGGYLKKVKDMWDEKDLSVRSLASLNSQLIQIPKTRLSLGTGKGDYQEKRSKVNGREETSGEGGE